MVPKPILILKYSMAHQMGVHEVVVAFFYLLLDAVVGQEVFCHHGVVVVRQKILVLDFDLHPFHLLAEEADDGPLENHLYFDGCRFD